MFLHHGASAWKRAGHSRICARDARTWARTWRSSSLAGIAEQLAGHTTGTLVCLRSLLFVLFFVRSFVVNEWLKERVVEQPTDHSVYIEISLIKRYPANYSRAAPRQVRELTPAALCNLTA